MDEILRKLNIKTPEERRIEELEKANSMLEQKNKLLEAKNQALSERADFIEDVVAEMSIQVYQ